MRLRVNPNGGVLQCIVDQGTGNPALDFDVCAIVQRRLRYHPGLNENGQRVADWAGYRQEASSIAMESLTMIEAEWWDYDSAEELAEAVAGDIGFIIESASRCARIPSLIALPGGVHGTSPSNQALAVEASVEAGHHCTDRRTAGADGRCAKPNVRAIAQAFLPAGARVIPITGRHRRLSAGRKFGGRAAPGPAVAA